jgi:hypothetical protein
MPLSDGGVQCVVKDSVTDRHQFHAGSDGIRGPGLVGLKTRWTHGPSAVKYFRPVAYLSKVYPRPTSATDLVVRAMDQTLHVGNDGTDGIGHATVGYGSDRLVRSRHAESLRRYWTDGFTDLVERATDHVTDSIHGRSEAHTSGGFLPLRDLPQQIARWSYGPS